MIDNQDSLPHVMKNVSAQPPDVNLDPTRYVTIVGAFQASSESTPSPYTLAQLFTDATGQLGTNTQRKLQVQQVKIWGNPGANNLVGSVTLGDIRSGISVKGSGTATIRPSAGIDYPPHLRLIKSGTGTGGDFITVDSVDFDGIIHTLCRVWA